MSYVKNTWANGDVITTAKLNNMETGIENASMVKATAIATSTDNGYSVVVTGATPQELYDAWNNQTPVYATVDMGEEVLILNPLMIKDDQETGIFLFFSVSMDDVESTKLVHANFILTYSSEQWSFEVLQGEMAVVS